MIVKEFRQIRRDPTSLAMLLVLPAILIVLVGYAMSFDVKHIPLVVFDQSRTAESRQYLERFFQTEYFDHARTVSTYGDIESSFMKGDARVALVIPRAFAVKLAGDEDVRVQIIIDGSDANSAVQTLGYAVRMTVEHSIRLTETSLWRKGIQQRIPVDIRPRVWYNPELVSALFLVPGLIGFILVLTAVVSTSMTVVREKERGTMEQLMVSPLRPVDIILGKTIPYLAISVVAATIILIVGYLLFGIAVKGSLSLLYAGFVLIILGGLGQGLLISTLTDSQQVAFMISVFSSLLPSFLLSGFVFPIASMPVPLQILSNIAVNKFFLGVVRGVMLKRAGLESLWQEYLYMMIFAAVTLGISIWRMQKRTF